MATRTETIQVSGVRCERCVGRLAGALRGHEGLELANANLMGQVQLQWDDEQTDREAILAAMARAGFRRARSRLERVVRIGRDDLPPANAGLPALAALGALLRRRLDACP